jgi:hypothetical protein
MPLTLLPPPMNREDAFTRALGSVASRWRRVVAFRAITWIVSLTILILLVVSMIDQRMNLPGLVRALLLIVFLLGLPYLVRRWITVPLQGSDDPIRIALRVEEEYPEFNDSLLSAVQFLQTEPSDEATSPELRRAAIRHAIRQAEHYDLGKFIDARWTVRSFVGMLVLLAGVGLLVTRNPLQAKASMVRLAVPFGSSQRQTTLEILAPASFPHRLARGEPLDLQIRLRGLMPDRVVIAFRYEDGSIVDQVYPTSEKSDSTLRIEPSRLSRSCQIRLTAGDAVTGWKRIQVEPPPQLVPLQGRPSPQLHLEYPAYTGMPSAELPDGSGIIECIAGTTVTLRAATDRPVARVYCVYQPEHPGTLISARLAMLGKGPLDSVAFDQLGREIWQAVPFNVIDGTRIEGQFTPRLSGPYAFRFEDETGLGSTRMLDIRVQPDPAPLVALERPAPGRDPMMLLPGGSFNLQARVSDPVFAIRRSWLEYRVGGKAYSVPFFDGDRSGTGLGFLWRMVSRGDFPLPWRVTLLPLNRRFRLDDFHHPEGRALREGDVLTLQVFADDYDNVTGFKAPGRSHEVEIRVVSKLELEVVEQQAQSKIRDDLAHLHAQQREANKLLRETQSGLQQSGKVTPAQLDQLARAEQLQQQIRNRINNPEDGLRAQLNKARQSAMDNGLPQTQSGNRLQDAANELDRLANNELEALEAELANGRKDLAQPDKSQPSLNRAEERQREIERTLKDLIERLEPGSGSGEIRGEARGLLSDLKKQMEAENRNTDSPMKPNDAKTAQEKLAADAEKVADRGRQLIERMQRLADEKASAAESKQTKADLLKRQADDLANSDPDKANDLRQEAANLKASAEELRSEADALRRAAQAGETEQLKSQLRSAAEAMQQGKSRQAAAEHATAAKQVEKVLGSLEESQREEQDRLAKKRREVEKDLDKLADDQDRLEKKFREAQQLRDPGEREKAMQGLNQEQESLRHRTEEMAQRLQREQTSDVAQQLKRAAEDMKQAQDELKRDAIQAQEKREDALDKLDDLREQLNQGRQENRDQLAREQQDQFIQQIKALRDREQRMLDEAERLHRAVLEEKKWDRPRRVSLNDLKRAQESLAGEVRTLNEKKGSTGSVFERMMNHAVDAMELASRRLDQRLETSELGPFEADLEGIAQTGIVRQQKLALKRLDQLIETLSTKPEQQAAPPKLDGMPPEPKEANNEPPPPQEAADKLPPLAQLKALRSLQADIAERTEAFDKAHPNRDDLNDDEVAELEALQKMQLDVAELIKSLAPMPTAPAIP